MQFFNILAVVIKHQSYLIPPFGKSIFLPLNSTTMEDAQLKRNFVGSDAYMAEQSDIGKALLEQNLTDFSNFDGTIDANFVSAFEVTINAALSVIKDSAVLSPQLVATQTVTEIMQQGRDAYNDLMYFVTKKAFKTNDLVVKEFNGNYGKASRTQPTFAAFLESLHSIAGKYKTQLLASGCKQQLIDSIGTIATNLRSSNTTQELIKRGRPTLTADRIVVLNNCYNTLMTVYAAAKQIYKNNPIKQAQFVYKPGGKNDVSTNYTGSIAAGATAVVATLPYNADRAFTLQATNTNLVFGLSADGTTIVGNSFTVTNGSLIIKLSSAFAPSGDKLICKNTTTVEGQYAVEADR
ncbi:MAG: hypothetical protein QM541_00580 [Flavobacterium sp.]|nr:hypothetical protein [Flavobacterium sp.]